VVAPNATAFATVGAAGHPVHTTMKERRAHWSVVRKLGAFAKIESYVLQPQFIKLGSVGVELSAARWMIRLRVRRRHLPGGDDRVGAGHGGSSVSPEKRGSARRWFGGDGSWSGGYGRSGGEGGWSGGEGAEDGVLNVR
jgi:hypothetical protein